MPTVPTYGVPEVRTDPLRQPLANPSEFAIGGQQVAELGQSVERLGGDLADIRIKIQDRANVDAVFKAETALNSALTDFTNKARERLGENAKDLTKESTEFFDKQMQDLGAGLTNEPQRIAFQKIAADRRNSLLNFSSQHEAQQMRQATVDNANASAQVAAQAIIADPTTADANIAHIKAAYATVAKINGTPQKVIDLEVSKIVSGAHVGVIKSLVDDKPGAASAYYKRYEKDILPSERDAVKDALRVSGTKAFSLSKALELEKMFPGDAAAQEDWANKQFADGRMSADNHDALVSRIRSNFNTTKAYEAADTQKALDEFYLMATQQDLNKVPNATMVPYPTVTSMADLPHELRQRLARDGSVYAKASEYLAARAKAAERTDDDLGKLAEVQDLLNSGEVTDKRQLLTLYGPYLTDTTMKSLFEVVDKSKIIAPSTVIAEYEDRVGKSRSKWREDPGMVQQAQDFQDYVYRRVHETSRPQDVRQFADEFFRQLYRPVSGSLDPKTTTGELFAGGLSTEGWYEATPPERVNHVNAVRDLLRREGVQFPEGPDETVRDKFYTENYQEASYYLQRNNMGDDPRYVAAYILLRKKGYMVSPAYIRQVAGDK